MIAVDTPILVAGHREDSSHHAAARAVLESLAGRTVTWAVTWPSIHEFVAIVTDPDQFATPTPTDEAIAAAAALATTDNITFIGETPHHLALVEDLLRSPGASEATVQNARTAAICLGNGISELWTADRDYSAFAQLHTHDPLTTQNR